MKVILKSLQDADNLLMSVILKDLIADHAIFHDEKLDQYNRYKTEEVPILSREFDDESKINNQINNSFDSEVIDTKVGYFIGHPITYQVDGEKETQFAAIDEAIQTFNLRSNIDDLDSETVKMAAIGGYAGRLLYIDVEGKESAMLLYPWEVIPIYDRSIHQLQYALRYYTVTVQEETYSYDLIRVEWYDNQTVTFYIEDESGGDFILDSSEPINPKPHMFDGVPVIIFQNNEEMQGDCEKVYTLIDAYDRAISDANSEIEEFRLAYLAFYGYDPTPEVLAAARKTGAFGLDVQTEGVGVEFITKELKDTPIENHLNRLEANILRFAKSINITDEDFAGNLSGIAIKYKLTPLENKCITLERKMTAALRQQFKLLCTSWTKKGLACDYLNIFFSFKRNIPVHVVEEAEVTGKLKGMVSEKTRLSLLSFVDDVEYEIEEMEKEMPDIDLDEFNEGEEEEELDFEGDGDGD